MGRTAYKMQKVEAIIQGCSENMQQIYREKIHAEV